MGVLILHGLANHRPPRHWQFQLAAALAAEGVDVAYPSLPDADDPKPEAWQSAILAALDELPGRPDVIAHSLGTHAWLALGPAIAERVGRVLLVAPPAQSILDDVAPAFPRLEPFTAPAGWELWASDADDYNPEGAAVTHGEPFGLPVRTFPGGGHLALDDGYGPWTAPLEWARAASQSIAAAA
ncbi:MAG: alpha/beta fold hydrolase [Solirubrobacteraceae bacterium]|nr:alpha/beta fold hydrolase [Solirubrobacteraceae bacterium]